MKRIRIGIAAVLSALLIITLSACSQGLEQSQKRQIADFYSNYVKEATSLNNDAINKAYADLSKENLTNQTTNAARDVIFKRFNEINPDFFNKLAVEYATYDEVGATYSSAILLSLATEGTPVVAEMPLDAITKTYDKTLKKDVFEIDRSQITAPVPLTAESLVTPVNKKLLPPVKIIQTSDGYKVIPDTSSLQEIGIPNKK